MRRRSSNAKEMGFWTIFWRMDFLVRRMVGRIIGKKKMVILEKILGVMDLLSLLMNLAEYLS